MVTENNRLQQSLLKKIIGKKICSVKHGHGSFLTLNLGSMIKMKGSTVDNIETGVIQFWIYMCSWELNKREETILNSENIGTFDCSEIFNELQREKIEDFKIIDKTVKVLLSNEFEFVLSPVLGEQDQDDDYFIFTDRDSSTISFCLESGLYYEE
ncbi:MAG: hypothetical protein ACJAS4_000016 [Bacteriovoracaceae bacterium]|jgi:hypothetical protein